MANSLKLEFDITPTDTLFSFTSDDWADFEATYEQRIEALRVMPEQGHQGYLVIDAEIIRFEDLLGVYIGGCERGARGTAATEHKAGAALKIMKETTGGE